jgi:hypothetical protein
MADPHGATPNGLPYPTPEAFVSEGSVDIRNLAQAVDPSAVDLLAAGLVAAAGWTIQSAQGWRMGPLVAIDIACTRTGAGIVVGATGNFVDVPIATGLPAAFRPADLARMESGRRLTQWAGAAIDSTGAILLTDGLPALTYSAAPDWFVTGVFHRGF